jgi:hypothetical protein
MCTALHCTVKGKKLTLALFIGHLNSTCQKAKACDVYILQQQQQKQQ